MLASYQVTPARNGSRRNRIGGGRRHAANGGLRSRTIFYTFDARGYADYTRVITQLERVEFRRRLRHVRIETGVVLLELEHAALVALASLALGIHELLRVLLSQRQAGETVMVRPQSGLVLFRPVDVGNYDRHELLDRVVVGLVHGRMTVHGIAHAAQRVYHFVEQDLVLEHAGRDFEIGRLGNETYSCHRVGIPHPRDRQGHTATLLADGRVLIAGGANFAPLTSAELYEPATGTFTETGAMLQPRSGHMAALLPNGKVLVAGGGVDGANAEIYDPVSGAFTRTANMHNPILLTSMALLLATGKVFIGGGSMSELYDPATGVFDTTGGWHAVVSTWPDAQALLTNGKVLVSGGDGNASLGATVWGALYDPGTGKFAVTGDMNTARESHNATTLPDGTALITGGQNNYGQTISAAEVYNPAVGGFTPTGSMITDRLGHTATLLNSGQVLIAGGVTVSQSFPSCSGAILPARSYTTRL
jgi:hypothetical protein